MLLGVLSLGLVYQFLLLVELVLLVLGFLRSSDGALMRESVKHTNRQSGPPEDLHLHQLAPYPTEIHASMSHWCNWAAIREASGISKGAEGLEGTYVDSCRNHCCCVGGCVGTIAKL